MPLRCLSFRRRAWYLTPSLKRGSDRLIPVQCFQEVSNPEASSSCWAFSPAKPSPKRWWWHSSLHWRGEASLAPNVIPASHREVGERSCKALENWTSPLVITVPEVEGISGDGSQHSAAGLGSQLPQGLNLSWFELNISILPFFT